MTAILAEVCHCLSPQFLVGGGGGIPGKLVLKLTSEFTLQIKANGRDEQKQKALQRAWEATWEEPTHLRRPREEGRFPATSPPPGANPYEAHPFSVLIVVLPKHLLSFHIMPLHLL